MRTDAPTTRHVLGPVGAFPPGSRTRVELDGRAVAVFNEDGRFYALRDVCPHMGAPLSAGSVWGFVTAAEVGCYTFEDDRKVVRCPWHGWEYELSTGQSWYFPQTDRVRAYDVGVEAGAALLADEARAERRLPGPYVADTFAISVEDDYVVVRT